MPSSKLRQAILLADIFGQEMEPLYNNIPTLLLPIGNIPMIEILLHHLYVSKIEQLTVIYSKNSYQIKQYIDKTRYGRIQRELTHDVCLCGQMCEHSHHILDEEQKLQIKYIDTHHQTPVNMLSQYLQDYDNDLDATFLVINGPTIFNFNLQEFYKQHVQHENNNYLATMAIQEIPEQGYMNSINAPYLIHYSKEQVLLNLQKFQNDDEILLNLVQYGVESTITTQCQPTEVYIFSKSMIPLIIEGKQKQSEHIFEIIQNQLNSSNEQQIGIYDIKNLKSGRVDCPRTYKSLNLMFIHNQFYPYTPQFNIFWKNGKRVNQQKFGLALIGNNLQLQGKLEGRSFIGSQCEISGRVVNSILGDNVKILPGADVIQSIILDNVTIGQNCYISDSIILRNTHIQNNVMLPPGSIIGSDIYQLENRTILNAIRCFTQTIWGLDQIVSHLSTQNIIYSDISLFKMFIFGQSLSIPISIIKTLPPIYIQEQFATQIALNRYQEICLFYEELHETPQNSCYENELQFIEISIQRLKNEADIENLYDDYEI
ncbi:Eukaryotic translation initiation factor 2B epsilon subunit, partial [Spironucleus salmonicida]